MASVGFGSFVGVLGLPVLHSGTAPHAGHASPKSGPSGQWPEFDTRRAITGDPQIVAKSEELRS